jgi:hypothetical protein
VKRARVWIKVETFDDEGGPSKEYTVPCRDVAEFDHYNHAAKFAVELAAAARRLAVGYKGAVVHDDAEERPNHYTERNWRLNSARITVVDLERLERVERLLGIG